MRDNSGVVVQPKPRTRKPDFSPPGQASPCTWDTSEVEFKEIELSGVWRTGAADTYIAVSVVGEESLTRVAAKACYVLDWPVAEVRIPWPEGLTPKEAILQWAREQERELSAR